MYEPNSYNQIVCGDGCRAKRAERLREERPKKERPCAECGEVFSGRGPATLCDPCREKRDAKKRERPPAPPPEPTRADEIRAKLAELDDLEQEADKLTRALIRERRRVLGDELWRLEWRAA